MAEVGRGPEHGHVAAAVAESHALGGDRHRRRATDPREPRQHPVVVDREVVRDAAERRGAGRLDPARKDDQEAGAERRELVHDVLPCPFAERGERDHGCNPDRDTGHRERRAQPVAPERTRRETEQVEEPHPPSLPVESSKSKVERATLAGSPDRKIG